MLTHGSYVQTGVLMGEHNHIVRTHSAMGVCPAHGVFLIAEMIYQPPASAGTIGAHAEARIFLRLQLNHKHANAPVLRHGKTVSVQQAAVSK